MLKEERKKDQGKKGGRTDLPGNDRRGWGDKKKLGKADGW